MGDEIYKVTIFRNPLLKDEIVFITESRKIYEITFDNGKKDLIKILSSDLYINVKSILKGGYKLNFNDFIKMINTGRIRITEYGEE